METDDSLECFDGSIHSIHVKNFFCHDNLEVLFNQNVNFIVGRNGSGKSAILAALVVGLGARAGTTNRGTNLSAFIKKGANSATVEIKLNNRSSKAYKRHIYGDYITIVRQIRASGGSSYKIKSASGEVISTKFTEVNAIILAHDIQVDNPISVLNQDEAKSFHLSGAKTKYSFFRKATNLDLTEANYVTSLENCKKASAIWERKNAASAELETEYKQWKTNYEQLQSRDEMEAQKKALENEYYWSEIAEFEREVELVQTQHDKMKARIDKLMDKLNKMEASCGENNGAVDTLKAQLEEKSAEKSASEQELRELESQVREIQAAMRSAQSSAAKHREVQNREKRKVADIEQEIQNIESGGAANRRGELEATAERAKKLAEHARARYNTAKHDAEQARANHAHVVNKRDEAQQQVNARSAALKQAEQQLRELQSRGDDSLAVYGAHAAELVARVRRAHAAGAFSELPRGPIGSYLKVKERKWGGALEHVLGGAVQAFCVSSERDSRKLFEIMGQVYGNASKPSVTCSKFLSKQHDVSRSSVRAGAFMSALDALAIEDPVVANHLIDNLGLEKVLLVPEHADAVRLADKEENVPANCSKIVTLDSTEYHPAPAYRAYGGAGRPSRYLHLSSSERQKQVRAEIQEAKAALQQAQQQLEEINAEVRAARDAEREASKAHQALNAEFFAKNEAATAAAAALQQIHQAPHHAVLLDELKESQEKLRTLNEKIEESNTRESELRRQLDEYDASMKKAKNKLAQATTSCRNLSEEIVQEQMRMEQGARERADVQQRAREDGAKLRQLADLLRERRARADAKTQSALKLCDRVDAPRDKALVASEIKKTQMKLSSLRSDGLSKAQVAEKLLQVKNKYTHTRDTLEKLKIVIYKIQKTTERHLSFCRDVQARVASRVQQCFQVILSTRQYNGSMEIDNVRGALEIKCTAREHGSKRHASNPSSLSGGERSFATVAFIMALWDCVELPFYFLDEFDVFMDGMNRKAVMELLVDHALKNTNRQFVFLTPQDVSSLTAGERLSIHRMTAPRPN